MPNLVCRLPVTILPKTTSSVANAWPGGHLIGKFELREGVSRTASGIVYRAWDRDLGFAVAVKEHLPAALARRGPDGDVLPASPGQEAAYAASLQSFIQATRALAHCDDPALVHVLQIEFGHGTAYRVMPWVDGEPLADARRRMPQPPDPRALRQLVDDVLGALEAFHRTGNVHGGVHPSQILQRRDGRFMLLGPADLAAEPAGGAAGPWTDLRGLAEVARFWIDGVVPGRERPRDEAAATVAACLSSYDHGVRYGEEFVRALDEAASPAAARRPQSVAEFRERLRRAERADARAGALVPLRPASLVLPPVEPASARTRKTEPPPIPAQPPAVVAMVRREPANKTPPTVPLAVAPPTRAAPTPAPPVRVAPTPLPPARAASTPPTPARVASMPPPPARVASAPPPTTPPKGMASTASAPTIEFPALGPEFAAEPAWRMQPPRSAPRGAGTRRWVGWFAGVGIAAALVAVALGVRQPLTPAPSAVASATPEAPATEAAPVQAPAAEAAPVASPMPAPAPASAPETAVAPAVTATEPAPPPRVPETAAAPPAAVAGATQTGPPSAARQATPPRATSGTPTQRVRAPVKRAEAGARAAQSPRLVCGARTEFALYRCMQQQCAKPAWSRHAQCVRLRATDRVD